MNTSLQLVGGYIRHRPLQAALAIGLLALGISLLSLLALLDRQLTSQFARNLAGVDLVIGAKGSPLQLVTSSIYHADAPTGNIPVSEVRPFGRPGHPLIQTAVPLALGDSYGGRRIVGTTISEFLALYDARVVNGEAIDEPYAIVAGATAAQRLGLSVGDTFKSVHGLDDNEDLAHANSPDFRVTGLLGKTGLVVDELLITDLSTVWDVHNHEHEHDGDDDHTDSVVTASLPWYQTNDRDITALLAKFSARNTATLNFARNLNANTGLMAAAPAIVMAQFGVQVASAEAVIRALGLIVLVASILSLFIILLNALRERRADLSLIRSLGATPMFVFSLVLIESFSLALIGAALGILLGRVGFYALSQNLADKYPTGIPDYSLHETEPYVVAASLFAALLAALYPAWRAYRIDPGLEQA